MPDPDERARRLAAAFHRNNQPLLVAWDFDATGSRAIHVSLSRRPNGTYVLSEEWTRPLHDQHMTGLSPSDAKRLYDRLRMKMVGEDEAFPPQP